VSQSPINVPPINAPPISMKLTGEVIVGPAVLGKPNVLTLNVSYGDDSGDCRGDQDQPPALPTPR